MTWNNSKINLSKAVRRQSMDEDVVLEYYAQSGMRIGGRWVDPPAVTAGVTASVQIATGKEKQLLPEAVRLKDAIEVWSTSELPAMNRDEGTPAARVRWNGNTYEVVVLEDWYEHGRYWFALCSKVSQ